METTTIQQATPNTVNRRTLLKRAGLLGAALPVAGLLLGACGSDNTNGVAAVATVEPTETQEHGHELAAAATTEPEAADPDPVDAPFLAAPEMMGPVGDRGPQEIEFDIVVEELVGKVANGVAYEFWTFNGTVPGPMLRVRVGDNVLLRLTNPPESKMVHNIDLHAVNGPGGGAEATLVQPGETKAFRFKALNPGLYVYHCATPPMSHHIMNGMFGMILVEPEGGLAPVDREYYVMQSELYFDGPRTQRGLRLPSMEKLLDERPDYVVMNGAVGALTGERAMTAKVGETVRIFFGVGGPNLASSFHIVGEIFDKVYPEAASEPVTNVQTTLVPAAGATIVEFETTVPGTYTLLDHSMARMEKGCVAQLVVEGPENPEIFEALDTEN